MPPSHKCSSYDDACYQFLRVIPRGMVTTYGELAKAVSMRFGFAAGAARAVGNAMNRNPDAPRTPCHRVVRSNGELGGYAFGSARKAARLRREGVSISGSYINEFERRILTAPELVNRLIKNRSI